MEATITLSDLLVILLSVAGIFALVYLGLVLKNATDILKMVKGKLEEHDEIIDDTFRKIPTITDNATVITANASRITTDTTELIETVKPEVEKIAASVGQVSGTVDDVARSIDETSNRVSDTVNVVSDSISTTAQTISFNADNIFDYLYMMREVIEAIRDVIRR